MKKSVPRHIATAIELASRYGRPLLKAEYETYIKVGYNKIQSGILVISTNIGAGLKYLSDQGDQLNDGKVQIKGNGPKASKSYQTRNRRNRYTKCRCPTGFRTRRRS